MVAVSPDEHLERSYTSTRKNHNFVYNHIQSSTDAYKYSFFPRTIPLWNKLDSDTVNSNNIEQFKNNLNFV